MEVGYVTARVGNRIDGIVRWRRGRVERCGSREGWYGSLRQKGRFRAVLRTGWRVEGERTTMAVVLRVVLILHIFTLEFLLMTKDKDVSGTSGMEE